MQLSRHFSLEEFEFSQLAVRRGFDNRVPDIKLTNLRHLVHSLLQPLRDILGVPVEIRSGYRCPRLNREMAGSRNSAHLHGLAADLWVVNLSVFELTESVASSELPFDIVMNEFGNWTHVQAARPGCEPQRKVMTAYKLGNNHTRLADGNLQVGASRTLAHQLSGRRSPVCD
ncbi:MAG: D-Ala-D-Ala carboxypeptidase family metallohydrolase [Pseudomonadota bacterium]